MPVAPVAGMPRTSQKIRYAVVGQGYIAQIAVLPAFEHARKNSELVALVSGDALKLRALGRKYGVPLLRSYERYDELLESGEIDAVYIALPNHLHRDYAVRAAERGVHVLCDKPMAVTARDCEEMIEAARKHNVRLMVGYRLHYEASNLKAIELARSGKLGDPRVFSSVFSLPVAPGNIRTNPHEMGGGPLYDIGIYCINAARYLFGEEPTEVLAGEFHGPDKSDGQKGVRFDEFAEAFAVTLRFPSERVASFVCSFGAQSIGEFHLLGTEGTLSAKNPYEFAGDVLHEISVGGRSRKKTYRMRDQFAPLLLEFSRCVLRNTEPESGGAEGLADVRVIEAILKSSRSGRWVRVPPLPRKYAITRPSLKQEIHRPPVVEPKLVRAREPSKKAA